jgi:hypothetical protein
VVVQKLHNGRSRSNYSLNRVLGEESEDIDEHLFICEKIWVAKQVTYEDTKMVQLAITFRDRILDWYMGLAVSSPQGAPTTIADVKKALINEFQ